MTKAEKCDKMNNVGVYAFFLRNSHFFGTMRGYYEGENC